jgi:hypothetical protein
MRNITELALPPNPIIVNASHKLEIYSFHHIICLICDLNLLEDLTKDT